jgi:polyisoprenoid-binding protein YceI
MTMNLRSAAALVAVGLLSPAARAADVYVFDKAHTDVSFRVRHLVTQVHGRFTDFNGAVTVAPEPKASSVELAIKAASVDTANERRDQDLRSANFFDVEKFPEITFVSTKVMATGKDEYDVVGTLTMHGVSREITLPVTFLGFVKDPRGNEKAGFATSVTLDRREFGLVWNRAIETGGMLLGDEVRVTIDIEANKQKEDASK